MIRIAKGDRAYCERFIQSLKDRVRENDRSVEDGVAAILRDVRDNGDRAVRAYSEKFDGWVPDALEISMEEIERIMQDCDPGFLAAMERAAENIRAFHARQKQQSRIDPERNGVLMGQRVRGERRMACDGEISHHARGERDAQAREEGVGHERGGQGVHPVGIEGETDAGHCARPFRSWYS